MSISENSPWFAETEEELFDYEGSKLIQVRTFFWVIELDENGNETGNEKRYTYTLTDKEHGDVLVKFDFNDQSILRGAIESVLQEYIDGERPYNNFRLYDIRICDYVWDTRIKRDAISTVEPFSTALVDLEDVIIQLKQECLDEQYSRIGEEYLVNYKNYLEESVSKLQELDNAVKQLLSAYLEEQK